jgi:asparagine synthetase B (glutamine-hydrolysing)
VSITGAAADELFTGYYDHHLFHLREVHADAELHAATLAGWREHVAPIVRNPYLSDTDRFVRDPGFRDHIYLGADEFRECRSPFLDRELFEFALSIPTRHLIAQGRAKFVLREAMRGIVPDLILDNPRAQGGLQRADRVAAGRRRPGRARRAVGGRPAMGARAARPGDRAALPAQPAHSLSKLLFNSSTSSSSWRRSHEVGLMTQGPAAKRRSRTE